MTAFDDEIAGLCEDIRRYTRNDERVEFCLTEMLKRINVEIGALVDEGRHLDRLLTEAEHDRIHRLEQNQAVAWVYPTRNWRNEWDLYEDESRG